MTSTTPEKVFMGMRIVGADPSSFEKQRQKEELGPIIEALLAFPEINGIRWAQYTPYFNDSDECIFSANEPDVLFTDRNVEEDDEVRNDLDDLRWQSGYGDEVKKRIGYSCWSQNTDLEIPNQALHDAYIAVTKAITGGAFDIALQELFGNHSTVTIIKGQDIEVEFYDHD